MSEATYSKVTLNGEDHILKYDFNAISELEQHFGKGIFTLVTEENIGFNTVRTFFWAGMLWKNPQLKVHHVGQMIEKDIEEQDDLDFEKLMETAVGALYNSKAYKLLAKRSSEKN